LAEIVESRRSSGGGRLGEVYADRARYSVKGAPDRGVTIQDVAFAAYTDFPQGLEPGLEGSYYYDRPYTTYPFGASIVVVEVDTGTGKWEVGRMVAVDDCGVRINPSIVEGQIHGGPHRGVRDGEHVAHHLIPTVYETPRFELGEIVTPSPHHPIGAMGVGESATVGSSAPYVTAVIDAPSPMGVTKIDMSVLPHRVWGAIQEARR
jgi:carbon-monoxide dehydrogenase large subunit